MGGQAEHFTCSVSARRFSSTLPSSALSQLHQSGACQSDALAWRAARTRSKGQSELVTLTLA